MLPRLLIVSAMPPNEFDPLTRQMPPELLLNVAARILKATLGDELKADVPKATSPDMVPELLTMTRPLLPVMLFPLKAPIATLMPLENRVEVIVPEFVRVASFALKLLIWMTELLATPSELMVPELLIERMPSPVVASPLPVPAIIPVPLGAVIVPLLTIVTLPPPWANTLRPAVTALIEDDACSVA